MFVNEKKIYIYERNTIDKAWIIKDSIHCKPLTHPKVHLQGERIFVIDKDHWYKKNGKEYRYSGIIISYVKNEHGKWVEEQILLPPKMQYNYFGESYVINDSNIYVWAQKIADEDIYSVVFIYKQEVNKWMLTDSIITSKEPWESPSRSINTKGDFLSIGCPNCKSINKIFGRKVFGGKVDIYKKTEATNWTYQKSLGLKNGESDDKIGSALSMYDNQIAVGNRDRNIAFHKDTMMSEKGGYSDVGSVCIYNLNDSSQHPVQELFPVDASRLKGRGFGTRVLLTKEYLFVGVNMLTTFHLEENIDLDLRYGPQESEGAIYVYKKENNLWTFFQKIKPKDLKPFDQFGISFSFNSELNELIVGANQQENYPSSFPEESLDSGKVYVFRLDTLVSTQP